MRPALSLTIAAAAAALAFPAAAQQDEDAPASIEAAIAGLIADVMPTERRPWARRWGDFERRHGARMVWSVSPPDEPARSPDDCAYSRTGWITVQSASAEVVACGDVEQIQSMSFEVGDLWLGSGDVINALGSRGVTAVIQPSAAAPASTAVGRDRASAHYRSMLSRNPALRRWRLERPDEAAASLTAEWRCTRPATRSATRCTMTWNLAFPPDN